MKRRAIPFLLLAFQLFSVSAFPAVRSPKHAASADLLNKPMVSTATLDPTKNAVPYSPAVAATVPPPPPQVPVTPLGTPPAALALSKTGLLSWMATNAMESAIESKPSLSGGATWSQLSAWYPPTSGTNTLQVSLAGPQNYFRVVARPTNAPAPCSLAWATVGICDSASQVQPKGIAVDHAGNIVTGGRYSHTVDFGGGVLTNASETEFDMFFVKQDSTGTLLWQKRFGAKANDGVFGVACDSGNSVVVCGEFAANVDFGGVALTSYPNPNQTPDAFVAKYSPAGNLAWVKGMGGVNSERGTAVAVDGADNVFVAMTLESPNVPWGGAVWSATTIGSDDILLSKLSGSNVVWTVQLASSQGYGVAADKNGDVLMCGRDNAAGGLFLQKRSGSSGAVAWLKSVNNGYAYAIACDPNSGAVVLTGYLNSAADFGHGVTASAGVFLAAYTSAGSNIFAKTFNTAVVPPTANDAGNAVAYDGSGNLALTGLSGSINFGGGWLGNSTPRMFLAQFTGAGVYRCAVRAGGTGTSSGNAAACDASGHVAVAGQFTGALVLGTQTNSTPTTQSAPFTARFYR